MIEIFEDSVWQMSLGERAAVEGVLAQLKPALSIEIGTAEGASLRRVAAHSGHVHSFDLVKPSLDVPENVTLHTGDSHALLRELLGRLEQEERNVDFALVDGDHSAQGVKSDLEDLLNSTAVQKTVILVHDVNNEEVRRGVDAVRYGAWPKVARVELDWVPGYMFLEERLRHELWGGLGLIIVDAARPAYLEGDPMQQRYYHAGALFAEIRDVVQARENGAHASAPQAAPEPAAAADQSAEVAALRAELEQAHALAQRAEAVRDAMSASVSWRVTTPLRAAKRRVRRAVG